MPGPLTQQASVPAFIDRFDGSGVAGQVLTLTLKPVAPLGYVATKVKDLDQRRGWKELKEGAGEGTYALNVAAKTVTLADAVEVGTDNIEVHYFYDPATTGGGTQDVNIVGDTVGLNKEVTQQQVRDAVDTLEAKVQAVRDQLDVLLSTRASEVTLVQVRDAVDTVEALLTDIRTNTTGLATQATLAAVLAAVDGVEGLLTSILAQLDVALSTRASEVTLAALKARADLLATEATLALVKAKTDNLDVLLSTRGSETTLVQVRDLLDTVETKLQSIIDNTDTIEAKLQSILDQVKSGTSWKTQQATIGTGSVELAAVPLTGRRSILVRAHRKNTGTVYVDSNNPATTGSGDELGPGAFIRLEVDATVDIFAIATSAGQKVSITEVA